MSDFLTVTQIANEQGVSRQYILAEIGRGNLDAEKLDPSKASSDYVISRKSYEAWKKKRRAKAEEA